MSKLDAKILKESIDEVVEKKLLTEDVKLVFFGRIIHALFRGDITLQESNELEKTIQFDRTKHKETVNVVLIGEKE